MNLPDSRVFDAFVRISDLPKESWSERVEACSELTDSEKTHLKLLLEESDQTKNRIEEPVVDEKFKRALEERDITILRQLGVGGMGVVFEGFETSTGRRVAVKRIRTDGGIFKGDLSHEIAHLSRVHHTNICSLYFSGTFEVSQQNRPYFVMEFIDGVPLDVFLSVNAISATQLKDLLLQFVDGIQYAHSLGVVHRDLKPSNIMVTRDSVLKILDFGISELCRTSDDRNVSPAGTPGYASPSQMAGDTPNQRMDIHAFGSIVKKLLEITHIKDQLGKHFYTRLCEIADSCLEQDDRPQLSLEGVRARLVKLDKKSAPRRSVILDASKIFAGIVVGVSASFFYFQPDVESSIETLQHVDRTMQSVEFAGAAKSSIDHAAYGLPNFERSLGSGPVSTESQLAVVYTNFFFLKSLGDENKASLYLSKSLKLTTDELRHQSATYHAALISLAALKFELSDYLGSLDVLRELKNYQLHPLHELIRSRELATLPQFIDQGMPFTKSENREIDDWRWDDHLRFLRKRLDGTLGTSLLMLDEIDRVVESYTLGYQLSDIPEDGIELINQALLKFRSSSAGTDFINDLYLVKWEAWLLYWSGNSSRAYDLISSRSTSLKSKIGDFSKVSLLSDVDLLAFMSEDVSLIDAHLDLARSCWLRSSKITPATDYLRLRIGRNYMYVLLEQALALQLSNDPQKAMSLGEEAVLLANDLEVIAESHYSPADEIWASLFKDHACAYGFAGEVKKAQEKFSQVIEATTDEIDLESYRLSFSLVLEATREYELAVEHLLINISNADSVVDTDKAPLRFSEEVSRLDSILSALYDISSDSSQESSFLAKITSDRGLIHCLEHIERQFKCENDARARPQALAELASLYISLLRPVDATRVLVDSLQMDLSELLNSTSGPVHYLKSEDQGWWEWDIELMLHALKQSRLDPRQSEESLSNARSFVDLANQARSQTAWFDVPIFNELVELVSSSGD